MTRPDRPSSTPERLYGLPDAETLYRDLAEAYEVQVEPDLDPDNLPASVVIEEWTVQPLGSEFPTPDSLIVNACENAADNGGEGLWDCVEHLERDPVVLAAAEAFRAALIERMTPYWTAHDMVAEHTITWDADGQPLADGHRLYTPAPGPGQETLALEGSADEVSSASPSSTGERRGSQ